MRTALIRNANWPLLLVFLIALFLRLLNYSFPFYTADESRLIWRGFTLSHGGQDELGRTLPIIFNSTSDYQLPMTSYLTALGVAILGVSDLGQKSIFILIGLLLVLLTYKIAQLFSSTPLSRVVSALLIAASPSLIFLSRVPNESIISTLIILLLFYSVLRPRTNLILIGLIVLLGLTTSKYLWFVMPPFIIYTLFFFEKKHVFKQKIAISGLICFMVLMTILLFLGIPQSSRSIVENNFSVLKDISIKNGIERLRTEGTAASWPGALEKLLFNKSQFVVAGILQWLDNLSPHVYFGQFDKTGQWGFSTIGAWPKALIIPMVGSVIFLIKRGDDKRKHLPAYVLLLTFPAIFIFPQHIPQLVVLTLPFLAILLSWWLTSVASPLRALIILLAVGEVIINLLYPTVEVRNSTEYRPFWIDNIAKVSIELSKKYKVGISDDLTADIVPFIGKNNLYLPRIEKTAQIDFPYKVRQNNISNIYIIGSNDTLHSCVGGERMIVFLSGRDLKRIIRDNISPKIERAYSDEQGIKIAHEISRGVCLN